MAERRAGGIARRLADEWLLLAILALAVGFVIGAQGFRGDAWKFPTAVGGITAALALLELGLALGRGGRQARPGAEGGGGRGLAAAAWFLATLGAVYALGVVAGVGVSAAVYFHAFVRRDVLRSVAAGVAHAAFFWIAFEVLAGFRLYAGVL